MKNLSSSIPRCLIRHLSTTASTTFAAAAAPISIGNAKQKLRYAAKAYEIHSSVANPFIFPLSCGHAQQITAQRLANAQRFRDVETLIESLKLDPKITEETYVSNLIRCYGKAGMFDLAIKLYEQMEELGTFRSCFSFNALLSAGNDSGAFDRVRQLFDEMPQRYGFDLDDFSYGILVQSYCGEGKPEMGLKLIEEMEGKGVEVEATVAMFATVVDAFYKIGKPDEAERVWCAMVEKGYVPDLPAWNIKIRHAREPEEIEALIDEMETASMKPNMVSYHYLIAAYCRNDRLDDAIKVYEDLEKRGFRPKSAIFNTLISYFCKIDEYGKGYDLFKRSVFYAKILDFETLKVLGEGLVKKNMKRGAKDLISTAKKQLPYSFTIALKKFEVQLGLVN